MIINNKIPKIIHYCWFGDKEKSTDVLRCIRSWKTHMPDFEIVEWCEENFSIENANDYVKEAYRTKKWAFVADYVRLYALYNYGGLYFDTDVEVFKSFDPLLTSDCFFGFETRDYLMTAVMGACKNSQIIKNFLKEYENMKFNANVNLNEVTNVVAFTRLMKKMGLNLNGKEQIVAGATIYPQKYFGSNDIINIFGKYSKSAYAYHHCTASWNEKHKHNTAINKVRHYLLWKARNIFGTEKIANIKKKKN